MNTFISHLVNNHTFTVDYKNVHYTAKEIADIVFQKVNEIELHLNDGNDIIFYLPKNNFEAFICLCVNSLLGTTGALLTSNSAPTFFSLISEHKKRLLVISDRQRAPEGVVGTVIRSSFVKGTSLAEERVAELLERAKMASPSSLIFITSGTTGAPKLIQHSEDKLLEGARDFATYLQMTSASEALCMFPVQFMYGLAVSLASLLSGSHIHYSYLPYNPELICDYCIQHNIDILTVLGDWIIDICHVLQVKNARIKILLNASDRLLVNQARKALEYCDTLCNTFGQTESGPSLLHNKIESESDIERYSYRGVIATGFALNDRIKVSIFEDFSDTKNYIDEERCGELFYQSPYCMDGYIDSEMNMLPHHSSWNASGDLFYRNKEGCYFWLRRLKEDLKVNGRFFPSQIIYNEFVNTIGSIRCIFSKNIQGALCLYIDKSKTPEENINIMTLKNIIHKYWNYSEVEIEVKDSLSQTPTNKLKLVQA
ncbi:AMP-binding protein [Vibrio mangrovi]|uniref:AMP-binding protein n=1 Tax=Vibrio mangrovi TaxID=474394 RepID=A0A1Y6IXL3_9VIBR|nr:AMP-binding protein [Vibrio mangrovi]MDW6002908.1 AMP-binding protein [Vibrio mangrovi]SMS02397.1 acyl-CoA synthetase [Vibrio mangrovi]